MTFAGMTWHSFKALLREWHLRRTCRHDVARLDAPTVGDPGLSESQNALRSDEAVLA